MNRLKSLLLMIVAAIAATNAFTLFVLTAHGIAFAHLLLAIFCLYWLVAGPLRLWTRLLAMFTLVAVLGATAPAGMNAVTRGMRAMGDKAIEKGPRLLTLPERFAAYHSLAWLSLGGVALGMIHSATENALMFLPGPDERIRQNSFPAKSALVRRSIERTLSRNVAATDTYGLGWPSYCSDHCDVAFALNGGWLRVRTDGTPGNCIAHAGVDVRYDNRYRRSTLFGAYGYYLRIDQAVFWALQELGWIFPYAAIYTWDCSKHR